MAIVANNFQQVAKTQCFSTVTNRASGWAADSERDASRSSSAGTSSTAIHTRLSASRMTSSLAMSDSSALILRCGASTESLVSNAPANYSLIQFAKLNYRTL